MAVGNLHIENRPLNIARTSPPNLFIALRAIRQNWLRSSLTGLGVIIGVGSVVLLISIGQGVKQDVAQQIDSLGSHVAFIVPGKLEASGQPNPMATLGISTLTEGDARALAKLPGILHSVPVMFVAGSIEKGKETYSGIILASEAAIYEFRHQPMAEGRFFTRAEESLPVCVLAMAPKNQIFGDKPAVGQTVKIRNVDFKVIGVQEPEKKSMFGDMTSFGNWVYIPYPATRKLMNGGQVNRVFLKLQQESDPKQVNIRIKSTLLARHNGKEDFGVLTPEQLLSVIFRVFNIVTAMVVGIGAISLVVAGIGIMNIMLVTVTERTREIGIRKTVGARRRDIFIQFLTEAMMLSFIGGLAGVLLSAVACHFIRIWTPIKPIMTFPAIALAFGTCFLVGIVFGVTPAMRAARQSPIDALRWE